MIQYLRNIQKVSLLFFIAVGAIHFGSGALFFNNEESLIAGAVFRFSFIPFVICALAYCGAGLKINIYNYSGHDSRPLSYLLLGLGSLIVIGLSLIFFFSPNL